MIFLALRWHNVASYGPREVELRFDRPPLTGESLVAIVGDTGAGKSTILDALCLALYGNAPRFSAAQAKGGALGLSETKSEALAPNDPSGCLNNNAREAAAQLDFRHADGNTYRATWSVKRKKSGEPDHAYNTLERREGDGWTVVCTCKNLHKQGWGSPDGKRLANVLGLDMQQFTRSIVLAQGDFAAFLRAPDNDKAELLEKVTGTQIYTRIAQLILDHRNTSRRLHDASVAERKLYEDQLLSAEASAEVRRRLAECEERGAAIEKEAGTATEHLRWLQKRAAQTRQCDEARATLEAATRAATELAPLRSELEKFDQAQAIAHTHRAYLDAQGKTTQLADRVNACTVAQKELAELAPSLREAQARADKQHADAQNEWKRWSPALDKAIALQSQMEAIKAQGTAAVKRHTAGAEALQRKREELSRTESELRRIESLRGEEGNDLSRLVLAEARSTLVEGAPCPLCGAIHHPAGTGPAHAADAAQKQNALDLLKRGEQWQARLAEQRKTLDEAEREQAKRQEECERLREQYRAKRDELAALQLPPSPVEEATAAKEPSSTPPEPAPQRLRATLQAAVDQAAAARERANKALADHQTRLATAAANADNARQTLADNERALAEANSAIEAWLSTRAGALTRADLTRLLAPGANHAANRQRLKQADDAQLKALADHEARQRQLAELLAAPEATEQSEEQLRERLTELAASRRSLDEERTPLQTSLARHNDATKHLAESYEAHRQLKDDLDTATDLAQLFAVRNGQPSVGDLRKMVQMHTLGRLLTVANKHLHNMRSRYRLRPLADQLDMAVVDHDMADSVRPTSSLSGGETFMVALALALALSSLTAGRNTYSALFIDEGFGSLSPQALEQVVDALAALEALYDKKVFIISHTEAIRDRVATHITVRREEATGASALQVG